MDLKLANVIRDIKIGDDQSGNTYVEQFYDIDECTVSTSEKSL